MSRLFQNVAENAVFVLEFLGIIAALILLAVLVEKLEQKLRGQKGPVFTTYKMAMAGVLSAMAAVLMIFEFPVFWTPPFYKLDFSELPILIGAFAYGPVAGVTMEFLKILLKLLIKPTTTAFVGELANFAVGCSFILPASVVYLFRKTKRTAVLACVAGTIVLTLFGTFFNVVYLIPAFAKMFMKTSDISGIMEMFRAAIKATIESLNILLKPVFKKEIGTAFLADEKSTFKLVMASVGPLNLVKGAADSIVAMLIYKPLSPYLKGAPSGRKSK